VLGDQITSDPMMTAQPANLKGGRPTSHAGAHARDTLLYLAFEHLRHINIILQLCPALRRCYTIPDLR
jgi:hypothetical protein